MLKTLSTLLNKQLEKLVFKDVGADQEMLCSDDSCRDPVVRAIITYRMGQARILRHCAGLAAELYEKALVDATASWKPSFVRAIRSFGGLDEFNAIAQRNGIFRGVVYSQPDESGGVRLIATAPLKRGDPIIVVPSSGLLTCEMIAPLITRGDLAGIASHFHENFEILASLLLLCQRDALSSSLLTPFFAALPREIDSPVFLEPAEMERRLAGTSLLADCIELHEQLFQEHQALIRTLPKASKKKARSILPLKAFLWARLLVEARIAQSGNGEPALLSLPFLPRHSPYHHLEKSLDQATGALVFHAGCSLAPGDEIFDNVGSDQSQDHFLRFGFLLADNDLDVHDVALDIPESDQLAELQAQLFEQLHLSGSQHFLKEDKFPQKLLDSIRVYAMDQEEL
jgi:hypothetical protein